MDKNELRKLILATTDQKTIDALWELYNLKIRHHDQKANEFYYRADKINGVYGQANDLVNRSPSTIITPKL